MVNAWNDYCRHHIVSKHALRLIRNFTLTQMPESIEADQEDEEETKAKTTWCEVATPWETPETIASWLDGQDIDDSALQPSHATQHNDCGVRMTMIALKAIFPKKVTSDPTSKQIP